VRKASQSLSARKGREYSSVVVDRVPSFLVVQLYDSSCANASTSHARVAHQDDAAGLGR